VYRVKVLGRALLAVRTDPNRFWMLLSGNADDRGGCEDPYACYRCFYHLCDVYFDDLPLVVEVVVCKVDQVKSNMSNCT
jgi:hypothetical protein